MSRKPRKKLVGGVLAGVFALLASVALATPALANSVEAGSLTFESSSNIIDGPTSVVYTNQGVTVSGGSATIEVTQDGSLAPQNEVQVVTISGSYTGTITFNGVTLGKAADGTVTPAVANAPFAMIFNGGEGSQLVLNNCTFNAPASDGTNVVLQSLLESPLSLTSIDGTLSIGASLGATVSISGSAIYGGNVTANAVPAITLVGTSNKNVVELNGGNTIVGGIPASGSGATGVAGISAGATATSGSNNGNSIIFNGDNSVAGGLGMNSTTPVNGASAISLTNSTSVFSASQPSLTLTFQSGVATLTGMGVGAGLNSGTININGTGNALSIVNNTNTVITGSYAGSPALSATTAGPVTITGSAPLIFEGMDANPNSTPQNLVSQWAVNLIGTSSLTIGTSATATADVTVIGGSNAQAKNVPTHAGNGVQMGTGNLVVNQGSSLTVTGGEGKPYETSGSVAASVGGAGLTMGDATAPSINNHGTLTVNGGQGGAGQSATATNNASGGNAIVVGTSGNATSGVITADEGTITAIGGMPGTGAATSSAKQGNGIQATAIGYAGNELQNDTNVAASGPTIIAAGAVALSTDGTGTTANTDITPVINPGSIERNTLYPWLIQTAANVKGSTPTDPVLVGFLGQKSNTVPTIGGAGTQWVEICPAMLTSVGGGLQQTVSNGDELNPAPGATYVLAEQKVPQRPSKALNQYKVALSATFDGAVENLDTTSFASLAGVNVNNGAVSPTNDVVMINNAAGTFYVPPTATGNTLDVSAGTALPESITKIYGDVAISTNPVSVPIVYTVTLEMGVLPETTTPQGSFSSMGTANGAPAKNADSDLLYYTAADGSGNLVVVPGTSEPVVTTFPVAGTTTSTTTPVVVDITTPSGATFIGYFDETGDSPVQIPLSPVSGFNSNRTITAEGGAMEFVSLKPSPITVPQGSSGALEETLSVDPTNPAITEINWDASPMKEEAAKWFVAFVMPDGSIKDGTANGVTVSQGTPTVTPGTGADEGTLTVVVPTNVNANGQATIGHYRVWPSLVQPSGTSLPAKNYSVVEVVAGSGLPEGDVTVYRLLNPFTGAHLITADQNEWKTLSDIGWDDEGVAFYAADEGVPVYRLLNPNNGDHMYTTSMDEYNRLETIGWVKEGTVFYGSTNSTYPIYRLWNRYQTANEGLGSHLWTADHNEYVELNKIDPNGWQQEGEAWFAQSLAPGTN